MSSRQSLPVTIIGLGCHFTEPPSQYLALAQSHLAAVRQSMHVCQSADAQIRPVVDHDRSLGPKRRSKATVRSRARRVAENVGQLCTYRRGVTYDM